MGKDWKAQTAKDGKEIKRKIGQDKTVSIVDEFDKKLYTYGDNWGRGGEVLYQAFGLKMSEGQKKLVEKAGWAEINQEKSKILRETTLFQRVKVKQHLDMKQQTSGKTYQL